MKRKFTKYPQNYVSAYTKPSYKNANFERFNKYSNDTMPKGKVLVVSEDNGVQSANGYYGTTKYGDIFGGHSYYYLLTNDGELYSSVSMSRWPLKVEALEEAFEDGRFFKKDLRDHWIDYNLGKHESVDACDEVTASKESEYYANMVSASDEDSYHYLVRGYYGRGSGLAEDSWADNISEVDEIVNDYANKGYYLEVRNLRTGTVLEFSADNWLDDIMLDGGFSAIPGEI